MPREQGESGEFVETIAPEDVLEVFDAVAGPVILSADVADHFGVSRETARRKLQQLYDRGVVDRRKVSRRMIYWRDDGGDEFDVDDLKGDADTTLADDEAEAGDPSGEDRTATATGSEPHSDTGADPIGDALDGWEPDTDGRPRTARTQTRRAAEFLRKVGEYRQASELKDALADGSSLSPETWWRNHTQPGLKHLDEAGLVEYTRNRGYRWIGDGEV